VALGEPEVLLDAAAKGVTCAARRSLCSPRVMGRGP
jgi:hypothetical protein